MEPADVTVTPIYDDSHSDDDDSAGECSYSHILHNLMTRLKVERAAILDLHGNPVEVTPTWDGCPDDGRRLSDILQSAARQPGLWKLFVFGQEFQCMHCDERSTILGHSKTTVMTAHATRKHIVVGLAHEQCPGSCLYEVRQAWLQMERCDL